MRTRMRPLFVFKVLAGKAGRAGTLKNECLGCRSAKDGSSKFGEVMRRIRMSIQIWSSYSMSCLIKIWECGSCRATILRLVRSARSSHWIQRWLCWRCSSPWVNMRGSARRTRMVIAALSATDLCQRRRCHPRRPSHSEKLSSRRACFRKSSSPSLLWPGMRWPGKQGGSLLAARSTSAISKIMSLKG